MERDRAREEKEQREMREAPMKAKFFKQEARDLEKLW